MQYLSHTHYKKYNGKLQKWLDSYIVSTEIPLNSCWKTSEGPGKATIQEIWVHVPLVLIIQFEMEYNEYTWTCPKILKLLQRSATDSFDYELIAKVIYIPSQTHFTGVFCYNNKVFDYDGMLHDGNAIARSGGKASYRISEKSEKYSSGTSYTIAVIYSLKDSVTTQYKFTKYQQQYLQQVYSIQLEIQNPSTVIKATLDINKYSEFPAVKRTWMSMPLRSDILDYNGSIIHSAALVTPKKAQFQNIKQSEQTKFQKHPFETDMIESEAEDIHAPSKHQQ